MPYIKEERRLFLNPSIEFLVDDIQNIGEVNYIITKICDGYFLRHGTLAMNYDRLNKIVGVFECAKNEFIRRRLNPYEDKRKEENGEVFD